MSLGAAEFRIVCTGELIDSAIHLGGEGNGMAVMLRKAELADYWRSFKDGADAEGWLIC